MSVEEGEGGLRFLVDHFLPVDCAPFFQRRRAKGQAAKDTAAAIVLRRKLTFEGALEAGFPDREAFLSETDPGLRSRIVDEWEEISPSNTEHGEVQILRGVRSPRAVSTSEEILRFNRGRTELTRLKIMGLISQVPGGSGDPLSDLSSLSPRGAWDVVTKFTKNLIDMTLEKRQD